MSGGSGDVGRQLARALTAMCGVAVREEARSGWSDGLYAGARLSFACEGEPAAARLAALAEAEFALGGHLVVEVVHAAVGGLVRIEVVTLAVE